jgi:hypothetical protein
LRLLMTGLGGDREARTGYGPGDAGCNGGRGAKSTDRFVVAFEVPAV